MPAEGNLVEKAYSVRSDFTGLVNAALIAWRLTVTSATVNVSNAAAKKAIHGISIL
jgi:hypothetical protein